MPHDGKWFHIRSWNFYSPHQNIQTYKRQRRVYKPKLLLHELMRMISDKPWCWAQLVEKRRAEWSDEVTKALH